jgi:hypothetical protein
MPYDHDRQEKSVERWQNAQGATKVKVPQANVAVFLEFPEQQGGYQKSAYDKEYRDSEVTVPKIRPSDPVFSLIGKKGVCDQDHKDRYGSKPVQ